MKNIFLLSTLLLLSSVSLFSNSLEKEHNTASVAAVRIVNDLVTADTFLVQISDCLVNGDICIDVPLADVGNYTFSEGGNTYANGVQGCMELYSSSYDYAQLFGQGNIGPYMLDLWEVDGTEFSGAFADISDLVDSMNLWNPTGNWVSNVSSQTITGGNLGLEYFPMDVTVMTINVSSSIPISSASTFEGTSLNLSVGTHWIQVIDNGSGLSVDSFFVNVLCVESSIENFTLVEDSIHVFCFDTNELLGQASSTQIICPSTGLSPATFNLIGGNACVEVTALSVGQDSACYVFCDNFGFCDTTYIYVTVDAAPFESGLEWIFETIYSNTTEQTCIDTIDLSGDVTSIFNDCPDQSGEYVSFTIDPLTYCIDYSAVDLGKDTACIFIMDALGNIDTTYLVVCVSNPITDTLTQDLLLGDTMTIYLDSTELGGDLILINNICENTGGAASFTVDTLTFCTQIIANQVGQDTACIILCDNFGVCDTTILIVNITETTPMVLTAVEDNESVLYTDVLILDVCANDLIPANQVLTDYYILPAIGGVELQYGSASFVSECNIIYTPDGIDCEVVDSFMYVICTANGCDTALVNVSLGCEPIIGGELVFTNGFSPNGDDVNQFFEIQGAETYPNNSLSIFNRWGNEVFKTNHYQNDWGGTFNGANLMNGTYFYLFNDGAGSTYTGYVYIRR
jgi:gliding motility-associated-like protein